jgi:hypothetical protein
MLSGMKEKPMRTTGAGPARVPLAFLAALVPVALLAQGSLVEQGRAAIARGDSDAAIDP